MKQEYIVGLWERALTTLSSAKDSVMNFPDTAANRAYYSAFFAVSALFSSKDLIFKKHTATRAAVHKELIHTGLWPSSLGDDYDTLLKLREVADYGVLRHATREEAADAIVMAERILQAVLAQNPEIFKLLPEGTNGELFQ